MKVLSPISSPPYANAYPTDQKAIAPPQESSRFQSKTFCNEWKKQVLLDYMLG